MHGIGYEGRTPDELVEELAAAGVRVVVDVRLHPVSRKPGFSRRRLAATLAAAGIGYVHEPSLGNPPENRDAFRRGDPEAVARYRARAAGPGADAVARIAARAAEEPVALLCVERDDDRCHRRVVADLVAERITPGRGPRARGHPRGR